MVLTGSDGPAPIEKKSGTGQADSPAQSIMGGATELEDAFLYEEGHVGLS
jgi:hypothetical protein